MSLLSCFKLRRFRNRFKIKIFFYLTVSFSFFAGEFLIGQEKGLRTNQRERVSPYRDPVKKGTSPGKQTAEGFSYKNSSDTNPDRRDSGAQIAEDILKEAASETVKFMNFTGTHGKVDTVRAIIGIGRALGKKPYPEAGLEKGQKRKYYTIRFMPEDRKLGADMIVLGSSAKVGHIKNIRRILSGFLQERYGYKAQRADSVAFFVSVYNAVKRQDRAYLSNYYTGKVVSYVPQGSFGLSTNYREWAGNSFLVIPLLNPEKPDAAEIGREASAKAGEGRANIEEREEFLKERKDQLKEKIDQFEKELSSVKEEEKEVKEKERELQKQKEKAVSENDQEMLKDIEDKEKALQTQKENLEQKKENLKDDAVAIEDEKAAIEKEAEEIAEDQFFNESEKRAEKEQEAKESYQNNVSMGLVFFLKTVGYKGNHLIQTLKLINPLTDEVRKVDVKKITGRYLAFYKADPLVIMYNDPNEFLCRLVRLDRKSFEVKTESEPVVYAGSKIWTYEDYIYVVGMDDETPYLYRFDTTLKFISRSSRKIFPDTDLTFYQNKVYCTVMEGVKNSRVAVFNISDLSLIKVIE